MTFIRPSGAILMRVIPICLGLLFPPFLGLAAGQDNRFDISADGTRVDFDLHQVARREVLDRLFADRGIKLDWLNRDVADEPIGGRFSGSASAVARQVLAPLNFVLAVDQVDGEMRITRVVVISRSSEIASPALAMLEAAMKNAEGRQDSAQTKRPVPAGASPIRPLVMTGTGATNLPRPTPVKSADPLPVPIPRAVPANVSPPTPRDVSPPSFVPIVGAGPVLPGPQPVSTAKKPESSQ